MKLRKEAPLAFALEYKFFDKLTTPSEIAIYAIIEKYRYKDRPFDLEQIIKDSKTIGISENECHIALNKLVEIDFLIFN